MAFVSETLTISAGQTDSGEWALEAQSAKRTIVPVIESATGNDEVSVLFCRTSGGTFKPLRGPADPATDFKVQPATAQVLPDLPGGFIKLRRVGTTGTKTYDCTGNSRT